ncbi:TetR-like C-terminal domain-containing protein [uncultured Friedmanniella sp.]|uniref:TetR-like C-terminal domain-containing protein n=1 Tax=uncultured Friedmanniella sp. TaxID=335381 RepID=UPI0035CC8B32
MTEVGAGLADELGYPQLSMGVVADRLGVKTPSLYKHVDGLADLAHRIAVLATTELGDAVRDATQGRAGTDALQAAAEAMRRWVLDHPGRYAATLGARPTGPDDPLVAATDRSLGTFAAVLRGYQLPPGDQVHALRMLRSALHGFVTLEAAGGFQYDTDVTASFAWLVSTIDQGLRTTATRPGS